jgi:hypothetical protein
VYFGHESIVGLCPSVWVGLFVGLCRGLGYFGRGFQTLGILSAHQVFEEIPQPTLVMPRGQGSSSRSTGTQGIGAGQPIESRRLILENTFAIKEEFSKNEATSWAVRELKRRGLKRLFKPVASTAYERLVREFYENLRCECDQQDVLFSSIDGEEVQVTVADIAAALKCNHEPPESDIPWLECPPMLTVEDIVTDMCDGHFADGHRNAASKTKIPRELLFIDMVLYRNVCPLGHKTQRRDLFLSALYAFHRNFWCSIPEIIWRQIQKFWDGVHHRGAENTKTWGLPFPFLVTHILRKKGIKGKSTDGPITESPYFGPIQWRQSISHMPRAQPQPQPDPMDIPEMADEPGIAAEPEIAAEAEEQPEEQTEEYDEEYEEGILITRSDLLYFQENLVDIRSQIKDMQTQFADSQRDARQDRLEIQETLRAIMERLPPAAGPSAAPPAPPAP